MKKSINIPRLIKSLEYCLSTESKDVLKREYNRCPKQYVDVNEYLSSAYDSFDFGYYGEWQNNVESAIKLLKNK